LRSGPTRVRSLRKAPPRDSNQGAPINANRRRRPTLDRLPHVLSVLLIATACRDPLGPDPNAPRILAAVQAEPEPELRGTGTIGTGLAVPTSNRQEFDIDVAWDLSGRLFFRDWSVVRMTGGTATVTVDPGDSGTWFSAFRTSSTRCAAPARGTEIEGIGRLDTDGLVAFTVVACDNTPGGSGADVFRILVPEAGGYDRGGSISSGDIAEGGVAPATVARAAGVGAIGPGTATLGSNYQPFDFDVTSSLTGRMSYSDYSVVRNGAAGRMIVDHSADASTELRWFHQISASCVRITGRGRVDTGELLRFYLDACDNASPGTGFDSFAILIPDRHGVRSPYVRSGSLNSGDVVLGSGSPPAGGNLSVSTTTSGSGIDPDGYTVTVDGGNARAIPVTGTVTYASLSAGSHTVALSGVAPNCAVSGASSRTVSVPSGGTVTTTFAVTCALSPSALAFSVQPTNTRAGAVIQPAVRVTVVDVQGNPVSSFNGVVSIAIGRNGSPLIPGTLSGTRDVNAVNGVATFSDLRIDQIGDRYTLWATSSGLPPGESANFNITF
jgi:hypothetical protein